MGLKETDLGLQYGRAEEIARGFPRDMDRLAETVAAEHVQAAKRSGRKEDYNRIGIDLRRASCATRRPRRPSTRR